MIDSSEVVGPRALSQCWQRDPWGPGCKDPAPTLQEPEPAWPSQDSLGGRFTLSRPCPAWLKSYLLTMASPQLRIPPLARKGLL